MSEAKFKPFIIGRVEVNEIPRFQCIANPCAMVLNEQSGTKYTFPQINS